MTVRSLILADCNGSTSAEIRDVTFAPSVDGRSTTAALADAIYVGSIDVEFFESLEKTVSISWASKLVKEMRENLLHRWVSFCTTSEQELKAITQKISAPVSATAITTSTTSESSNCFTLCTDLIHFNTASLSDFSCSILAFRF